MQDLTPCFIETAGAVFVGPRGLVAEAPILRANWFGWHRSIGNRIGKHSFGRTMTSTFRYGCQFFSVWAKVPVGQHTSKNRDRERSYEESSFQESFSFQEDLL